MPHPIYPSDEILRQGEALYEQQIRSIVEPNNVGKYLAIDIETGGYEIGDEHLATAKRALAKHPGAALFVLRVGYPAVARIGANLTSKNG